MLGDNLFLETSRILLDKSVQGDHKHLGESSRLKTAAARAQACDLSFITSWHQIWVRARQMTTPTVSWKPTVSRLKEGEKKNQTPTHTSKGGSFILSIKAHYSTMIKAKARRVAQSFWRNWNLGFRLLAFRHPGLSPVSAVSLPGAGEIH